MGSVQDDGKELEFDVEAAPAHKPPLTRLERRQLHRSPPSPPVEAINTTLGKPEASTSLSASQQARIARLERKAGDGTKAFTRFVTRPETTVAADLASERAPLERAISSTANPQSFGKLRDQVEPEFRANRLQGVMDDTYTHSRLSWLDHLGRIKTLAIAVSLTMVTFTMVWPYFKEVLRKREVGVDIITAALPAASVEVRQIAIRRAFDSYLAAPNFTEKLQWVLEPERVESRMKDFYTVRFENDPAVVSYEVSAPLRAGRDWWFTLECRLRDGSLASAIMKENPEGGQLDWENFTAYGSMAWEKFHTSRPTLPQSMRVRLRPAEQFSQQYPREDYMAFEVSHRSGSPTLIGYAPKNSRSGQWLADESEFNDWKPANLYLFWQNPKQGPPSLIIGDLIRNNWLDGINAPSALPMNAGASAAKSDLSLPSSQILRHTSGSK